MINKETFNYKKATRDEMQELYNMAHAAGHKAAVDTNPVAMIVGESVSFLGKEIDYSKPVYWVDEGACGFAWVNVKPGNSRFAKFLKEMDYARSDEYYGGVCVWVSAYGQSVDRKDAYARAFSTVLREYGVDAYSASRLD